MNEAIAVGLYIVVSKEMNPDSPVIFPGTRQKWTAIEYNSSALLNSYIEEWAALAPQCKNEAFNAVNGDAPTWARMWPLLLNHFDAKVPTAKENFGEGVVIPEQWQGHSITLPTPAPIDRESHSPHALRLSMTKWSKDPKVIEAWKRVRDREGLDQRVWDGASWGFADVVLGTVFHIMLGAQKLRRKGFFGTVDTVDNWIQTFQEAAEAKLLPKGKAVTFN